jgi:autotransporter-associated beta strand protein
MKKGMKNRRFGIVLSMLAAGLFLSGSAQAGTKTWSASATTTSWNLDSNWEGGAKPVAGDDVVVFGRTVASTAPSDNSAYTGITLNSLTMKTGIDGNVNLTLGSALKIGAGGITNSMASGYFTVQAVDLTADQVWAGTRTIIVGGAITGAKLTSNVGILMPARSPAWTAGLFGVPFGMQTQTADAGGTCYAYGAGPVTMINQYVNGTVVSPVLSLAAPAAATNLSKAITLPNNLILQDNSTSGNFGIDTSQNSVSPTNAHWILTGTITGIVNASRTLTFSVNATYTKNVVYILTGTNTYTAQTVINTAPVTLQIGNGGTTGTLGTGPVTDNGILVFNHSDDITISNFISGAGMLIQKGPGNITLTSTNTFTGPTTISAGKVKLDKTLSLQNSSYDTLGSTDAIGLDVTGLTALTLGGLRGNLDLTTAITGYSALTNLTLNPQGTLTNTYSGVIANGSGDMPLVKSGTGTQILAGTNTFSGGLTINAGTLIAGAAGSLGIGSVTGAASSILTFNIPVETTFSNKIHKITGSDNSYLNNSGSGRIILSGTLTGGGNSYTTIRGTGSDGGFVLKGANTLASRPVVDNTTVWVGNSNALDSVMGRVGFGDYNHSGKLYLLNGITFSVPIWDFCLGSNYSNLTFTVGTDQTNAVATVSSAVSLRKSALTTDINTWNFEAAEGAMITFSGVISQDYSTNTLGNIVLNPVNKIGTGIVIFKGNNTYGGVTTVSNGTLWVNNTSGSGTGTNRVSVLTGATLGGVGMITGPVSVASSAALAPGTNSVGTLTVGSLTLSSNATFAVRLGGTAVISYDRCVVTKGTIDLTNAKLSVAFANGFLPAPSDTFTIIRNVPGSAVTGRFTDDTDFKVAGIEGVFRISYTGGAGQDVVLRYMGLRGTIVSFQ